MYGKIFERMFTGTMYGSGPVVFAVWAYVIANARPPGVVSLNQKMLAATIGCSTEEIRDAIGFLTRPDDESATKEENGRRLVHIESLDYHVVSWQKYRDMRDEEERREYQRKWVAAKRAEARKSVDKVSRQESTEVDGRQMATKSTKAEAEAEAFKGVGRATRSPTTGKARGTRFDLTAMPDEWRAFCTETRPDLDAESTFDAFGDYWRSKPGAGGLKLDWLATWRNWVRSQKASPRSPDKADKWWERGNYI